MMNIDDLHEDQKERIISSGIELMSAITDSFGPEEGMKIWEDLSNQFGNEIKHLIFMAMLTGRTSGVVTINGDVDIRNRVPYVEMIKIIRNYTGFGLKEAKDVCDMVSSGSSKTIKLIQNKKRADCMKDLRNIGVVAF